MLASLTKEPMSYKSAKHDSELVTKLRIIRRVKVDEWTNTDTAVSFRCHRNTVGNLLTAFEAKISVTDQVRLLKESFTNDQIMQLLLPLEDHSTRPHHHPKEATMAQVDRVKEIFETFKVKVGPEKMGTILQRKFSDSCNLLDHSLSVMGTTKLKGIYKREKLQIEKARATSGSYRPLYDYTALSCFERMHFDTKHIMDKKALPPDVYEYFSTHLEIPRYEWNLIDAKSRTRFMAYSHTLNAEFGLKFLLFTLQFIRTMTNNQDLHITIGYDNGSEFCSGSPPKLADWNALLNQLNASAYAYHPNWDTRKNLIERSHRSDDEEFYIPRGDLIKTQADFMKEASDFGFYWNCERPHSGIGMNDRTPFEVLKKTGLLGTQQLMQFPTLLLDRDIGLLRKCTEPLLFNEEIHRTQAKKNVPQLDQKTLVDIALKYDFFTSRAQKVLTYYLKTYGKHISRKILGYLDTD
jgi:uncharacterized protein YqgV (UPF0045/DUF77 family)